MPKQIPFALTPKFLFKQIIAMGLITGALALPGVAQSAPSTLEFLASFVLESGISARDGTLTQGGLAFERQATLSLPNKRYGSSTFGRCSVLSYTYLVPMDPFAVSSSQACLGASFGSVNGVRPNNFPPYLTPMRGDWQAGMGYSFNTGYTALYTSNPSSKPQPASNRLGTNVNMRLLTIGINYNKGPTSFFVSYDAVYGTNEVITDATTTQPNSNKAVPRGWVAGRNHDFKFMTSSAAIGQTFSGIFLDEAWAPAVTTHRLTTLAPPFVLANNPNFYSRGKSFIPKAHSKPATNWTHDTFTARPMIKVFLNAPIFICRTRTVTTIKRSTPPNVQPLAQA